MVSKFGKAVIVCLMAVWVCVHSKVSVSNADTNVFMFDGFTETPNKMVEMEASEALGAVVMEKLGADTDKNFPNSCFQQCTEKTTCDLVIIWTETSQCVLMSCRPANVCQFANEGAIGFKMFLKDESEVETSETTQDPISFPEAADGQNGIDFEEDPEDSEKVPVCEQPKRVGPCRAAFPRFFFNKATLTCEPFIYGGCRPNENNFQTKEKCLAKCGIHKPKPDKSENADNDDQEKVEVEKKQNDVENVPVCKQPKEVGVCKAALRRFYFNQKTKLCESFIYGGCKGNGNNFKKEQDCIAACVENVLSVTESLDESSNETVLPNVDPFHSAHRQTFGHEDERGLQMMSPAYQLEAVVPLVIGALISMAMLILVIYRCHVNRQTGPKRLHKIVYDGPPPTVGELHSDDEVVNGMYT